jgi:hypothetical protein
MRSLFLLPHLLSFPFLCAEEESPPQVYDPSTLRLVVKAVLRVDDPRVDDAIGPGPLTLEAAMNSLTIAGLKMNSCRRYHVRKALRRPPPDPPVVLARTLSSIVVRLSGYLPHWDVPATEVVLEVDDTFCAAVVLPPVDDRGPPSTVTYTVTGLRPGGTCTLRSRCRVGDPLQDAALPWSVNVTARTLCPPGLPRAPFVVERGSGYLKLQLHNPGTASDPAAVALALEVNGVVSGRLPVPQDSSHVDVLVHRVPDLEPGVSYQLRSRCCVDDPELDATLPWSQACVAKTHTTLEVWTQSVVVCNVAVGALPFPILQSQPWTVVVGRLPAPTAVGSLPHVESCARSLPRCCTGDPS